jgi:hypothetical protein
MEVGAVSSVAWELCETTSAFQLVRHEPAEPQSADPTLSDAEGSPAGTASAGGFPASPTDARAHVTETLVFSASFVGATVVITQNDDYYLKVEHLSGRGMRLEIGQEVSWPDCAFELHTPTGRQLNFLVAKRCVVGLPWPGRKIDGRKMAPGRRNWFRNGMLIFLPQFFCPLEPGLSWQEHWGRRMKSLSGIFLPDSSHRSPNIQQFSRRCKQREGPTQRLGVWPEIAFSGIHHRQLPVKWRHNSL